MDNYKNNHISLGRGYLSDKNLLNLSMISVYVYGGVSLIFQLHDVIFISECDIYLDQFNRYLLIKYHLWIKSQLLCCISRIFLPNTFARDQRPFD